MELKNATFAGLFRVSGGMGVVGLDIQLFGLAFIQVAGFQLKGHEEETEA